MIFREVDMRQEFDFRYKDGSLYDIWEENGVCWRNIIRLQYIYGKKENIPVLGSYERGRNGTEVREGSIRYELGSASWT